MQQDPKHKKKPASFPFRKIDRGTPSDQFLTQIVRLENDQLSQAIFNYADNDIEKIATAITSARVLKELTIEKCRCTSKGFKAFVKALQETTSPLEKLHLSMIIGPPERLLPLWERLPKIILSKPGLMDVNIQNCDLPKATHQRIMAAISTNKQNYIQRIRGELFQTH
ncbi:MAG: hypothetical protein LBU87_02370 [Lactobacillales bacterium]|nr:hypothetical protein [Lactobacillales bacterium]